MYIVHNRISPFNSENTILKSLVFKFRWMLARMFLYLHRKQVSDCVVSVSDGCNLKSHLQPLDWMEQPVLGQLVLNQVAPVNLYLPVNQLHHLCPNFGLSFWATALRHSLFGFASQKV